MVAYFARRLIGGFVTLLASTFLLHSLILYTPGGTRDQFDAMLHPPDKPVDIYLPWRLNREYHFDIGWPGNYFVWLFSNSKDDYAIPGLPDNVKRDIDIRIGDFYIQGSGILTGDFGQSISYSKGVPTLELYGIRLVPMYPVFFSAVSFFMLIAILQRRGRPHPYRSSRIPANARWRPAELWTTG